MITLLYKDGARHALTNWRSIILLNLDYKIYTKALQFKIQPILMDVIRPN